MVYTFTFWNSPSPLPSSHSCAIAAFRTFHAAVFPAPVFPTIMFPCLATLQSKI